MMQQLISLQQEIHQWAKDWGFWENGQNRSKGEMVMLMITELSEAVEAHRKNHLFSSHSYKEYVTDQLVEGGVSVEFVGWARYFADNVKDRVEDEIADAVIRILDYTAGWNIPLLEREYRKVSTGNFAHDVLELCRLVMIAFNMEEHPGYDWGYVLAALIKFCEWYNINLLQHVEWKMRYNRTRPHKHGKAY